MFRDFKFHTVARTGHHTKLVDSTCRLGLWCVTAHARFVQVQGQVGCADTSSPPCHVPGTAVEACSRVLVYGYSTTHQRSSRVVPASRRVEVLVDSCTHTHTHASFRLADYTRKLRVHGHRITETRTLTGSPTVHIHFSQHTSSRDTNVTYTEPNYYFCHVLEHATRKEHEPHTTSSRSRPRPRVK